ncbi:YbaY family lipoprotein, partial [Salmonella enterica subsp. enterica]
LPAYQREINGSLNGVPANAEVELALLVIDERNRPQQLLASSVLIGNNKPLAFRLRFNPQAFPAGARVELRGRASQSGQLILHLPAVRIEQAITQTTGPLQLVRAP